jgi:ankyrin repeat protein
VRELEPAQLATVGLLLAFGAEPSAQAPRSGSTPLHLAARSGATAVAEALLAHGAALVAVGVKVI